MAIPTKGVNNIRTLSGRVDQVSLPYRSYMQITCLEMEKARRNMERKSASERIALIDARLEQIEKTKQELLQAVTTSGQGGGGPRSEARGSAKRGWIQDPLLREQDHADGQGRRPYAHKPTPQKLPPLPLVYRCVTGASRRIPPAAGVASAAKRGVAASLAGDSMAIAPATGAVHASEEEL